MKINKRLNELERKAAALRELIEQHQSETKNNNSNVIKVKL